MIDPKQLKRFSDTETELIQKSFKDSPALFAIRNVFLQLENSEAEKQSLNFSEEVVKILQKQILPVLQADIPIWQQRTLYQPLMQIRQWNVEPGMLHIKANDLLVQYIKQQFKELVLGIKGEIILNDLVKELSVEQDEVRFINMLAYHAICSYVEGCIQELKDLANPAPELTPEQKKEKSKKDSNK